ncbi:MAG TPA: NUDIX hydrolase [Phenylobacterium sp.]|nr:NUDIX hydrolase [Phenylobacterium sp.]
MSDSPPALQVAALPFRRGPNGVEIMLITSRETRRWVVPKGWPMEGRTHPGSAEREAFEEAGLSGAIAAHPVGVFGYLKRAKGGDIDCRVEVYPLEVAGQADDFPEKGQRETRWFLAEDAAASVDEPELRDLIRRFAETL